MTSSTAALLPFVRDGLERDERAYHLLHSRYYDDHLGPHLVAIVVGLLYENPFFVRPDVLLREVACGAPPPTPYWA
jgi:hypothetical protein